MKKVYNETVMYIRCVRLCVVVKLASLQNFVYLVGWTAYILQDDTRSLQYQICGRCVFFGGVIVLTLIINKSLELGK